MISNPSHFKTDFTLPFCSVGALPLTLLVPRLWPFLKHNVSSVRRAVLDTLLTLLSRGNQQAWLPPLLQDALRLVYQRSLLECKTDILEKVYRVGGLLYISLHYDQHNTIFTCQLHVRDLQLFNSWYHFPILIDSRIFLFKLCIDLCYLHLSNLKKCTYRHL